MQSITTGGDRELKPCTCYRAPCGCYNTIRLPPLLLCTRAVRGRDSLHKREPTTLWVSAFSAIPSHPRALHDRKFWTQYKTVKSFSQTTFFLQRIYAVGMVCPTESPIVMSLLSIGHLRYSKT